MPKEKPILSNRYFYVLIGKSFKAKKDSDLIRFGEEYCKVAVDFEKIDREGRIEAEINNKKIFYINQVKQSKMSDIIGKINIVMFTPDDIEIIKDGPDKRRKFLDMMISSLKPNYLHLLNHYNQVLEQRNNYLKQIKFEKKDENLLDIWDEQLADFAYKIFEYRKFYLDKISENIKDIHNLITKCGKEDITIKYISSGKTKETVLENLKKSRTVDIQRGYTGVGIHRDDFIIYVNGKMVYIFGSQGQKRTAILTLKLCEMKIMKDELQDSPILLLDDFMSELDETRRKSFLENIKGSQVIITCTDRIYLENESSCFYVENGKCEEV